MDGSFVIRDVSPVICAVDWCPCVSPDPSVYISLPRIVHRKLIKVITLRACCLMFVYMIEKNDIVVIHLEACVSG